MAQNKHFLDADGYETSSAHIATPPHSEFPEITFPVYPQEKHADIVKDGFRSSSTQVGTPTESEFPEITFPNCDREKQSDLEAMQEAAPPAAPPGMRPEDFPDGGATAWSVALGAWCCLFASYGWVTCIGVFQTYYQGHQLSSYTPSSVAWIPSFEVFVMQAGAPLFGKIFDNYGARFLLVFGTFFHVFGLMMTSLSTQYYQLFLAQSLCSAMGAAAIFYAGISSLTTWFLKRRALAFGLSASGSSLGGVIMP